MVVGFSLTDPSIATLCSSSFTTSMFPPLAAEMSAPIPVPFRSASDAPWFKSQATSLWCPQYEASSKGVSPFWFFSDISAPVKQ